MIWDELVNLSETVSSIKIRSLITTLLVCCDGEGNGTPLQYSCLENPMNGGTWKAAVHGVAKSWTRLSDFTFTFHFYALEKEMATHSSVLAWRIPGMGAHRIGHDWSDLAAAAGLLWRINDTCRALGIEASIQSTQSSEYYLLLLLSSLFIEDLVLPNPI